MKKSILLGLCSGALMFSTVALKAGETTGTKESTFLFDTKTVNNNLYIPAFQSLSETKDVLNRKHKRRGGDDAFEQGKSIVSLGYGVPSLTKLWVRLLLTADGYSLEPNFKLNGMGPIHAKYEYAITDRIGLGLSVGFASFNASWDEEWQELDSKTNDYITKTGTASYKGSSTSLLARFNFHFVSTEHVDFYGGAGVGYNLNVTKFTSQAPEDYYFGLIDGDVPMFSLPVIGYEGSIGLRYFFTPNIGAYTELGYGKSILQFGLNAAF